MKSLEMLAEYSLGNEKEKTLTTYCLFRFGRDFLLTITGGETHIGSIACTDSVKAAIANQFTLLTHREDEIVRQATEALKSVIPGHLLVVGGIHYDDISREQISTINENCRFLKDKMVGFVKTELVG